VPRLPPPRRNNPYPPPENNVEDKGEAQPEQQPAEGAGPADANSEETEEQPGDSVVTYTITFTDELGTASDETGSEITQAAEGTLVTITAKDRAEEGLLFTAWQAPEGLELADDTEEITTFTMPDSNVELAAEYAPLPEDAEALAEEEEIMLADASGVSGDGTESNPYIVTTFDEFKEAMQQGTETYIKLGKDINTNDEEKHKYGLTTYDQILVGNTITLDLNGKKLTLNSRQNKVSSYINVTLGNLTVQDSVGGGEIFLNDEYEGGSTLILLLDTATFTLKSGTIRATTKPETSGIDLIQSYGTVNIEGGTLTCTQTNGEIGRLHSDPNHWTSCYALNCFVRDNVQTTITGGEFTGFVRIPVKNNGKQNKITNVTFDGSVVLDLADEKNMTWSKPSLTVENAEVKGTLFINGVCYHEKSTDIAIVIGDGWYATLDVNDTNVWVYDYDLFKQTYEAGGNDVSKATFKHGYAPYQLKGGTYRFMNFGSKAEHDIGYRYTQEAFRHILGNGAIKVGNYDDDGYKIYTYSNIGESFKYGDYMAVMNSSWKRIPFIPNAWGMKSVTLDGKEINYAKDWKGAVEEMDNNTAHTIKFQWNPLASELVNAGYSYRAECDRYISGSTTPTTDPISATATEYSFTIPAGADPKVYSFDLHLNLNKNGRSVGIFGNEHIVKLVVNGAPVVEPDPTIEGKVYYTSGIVFGHSISTAASVTPESATKAYQWQRSTDGGSTWADIDGATTGSYTPVAADMGENVRIRVKITAEGYLGEIVGAPVKISKAANNNYPEVIKLEAVKNGAGAYTGFKITNFDSDCEYVYSTTDKPNWSANQITSATVTGLTSNTTYYVFARFKETNTHTAGSIVSKNSIKLYKDVPLQHVLLEGYDSGNTIYIKKGESVTLKVSADPSNANSWNKITFKDDNGGTASNITIENAEIAASTGTATPFPNDHTITITGVSTGSANLRASYPSATSSAYGTWHVVVYDDSTVADALRLENVYAYEDITLSVNNEAELPTNLPKLLPENSGYHLEWRIVKVGAYGASYKTSDNNITLENGKIKPKAAHAASEKTRLDLVAVKDGSDTYKTLPKTSLFYVTVTAEPEIQLTKLELFPKQVSMDIGKTRQLSAVKTPANAVGDLTWNSDKPEITTVSNTGVVTTLAAGTATITVRCGDKSASCTVMVAHTHDYDGQPYLYLDPGSHYQECKANDGAYKTKAHDFSAWKDNSDGTHSRTCSKCHKAGETTNYTETASHNWQWVVDTVATPNAAGKKHEECTDCHAKRKENTEIPMMASIKVEKLTVAKPAKDAKAAAATTTDSAYTVVNTEWKAADGSTLAVGEKFKPGTVYTVKITLKAKENNVFTADSTYNKIEGKAATLVTAVTGHTDSVILTYTFDATEGVAYNITEGADGIWVKGSTDTLRFKADGDFAKFKSVQIDGTELAPENYTKAAGSTVITLKNEYLSTLAVGAHTIAIIYTDGDCSTSFTVHQHTYGAWSSDDTHHWHECTDASCPGKDASVIDKAEHTFVWKIDVPASQASTGTKHEECTVCGKKRNENTVIDKLPGSSSGSHHSSNNSNNNNTSTEAAAPEAAAPAPAASAPVTTTTSARTGDSSNLIGWLAVLLISGGAAGAWYTVAKKKKEQ